MTMKSMRRRWCLCLCLCLCLGLVAMSGVTLLLAAQPTVALEASEPGMAQAGDAASGVERPQPPPAQDEFVPVSELPPEEQLPAAPFLIGAYAIAWLVVLAYVWRLWKRLGRVEQELREALRAKGDV
ncbi:MAG: CcmD family protein [Luteitalea sp.]|nr:CcmD family protein [Luteitalea sp.]